MDMRFGLNEADTYRERLDAPDDARLLRYILHAADRGLELGRVGVGRNGNDDLHVVCGRAPLELGFRLDHVLDATVGVPLDNRLDPDERFHLGRGMVEKGREDRAHAGLKSLFLE